MGEIIRRSTQFAKDFQRGPGRVPVRPRGGAQEGLEYWLCTGGYVDQASAGSKASVLGAGNLLKLKAETGSNSRRFIVKFPFAVKKLLALEFPYGFASTDGNGILTIQKSTGSFPSAGSLEITARGITSDIDLTAIDWNGLGSLTYVDLYAGFPSGTVAAITNNTVSQVAFSGDASPGNWTARILNSSLGATNLGSYPFQPTGARFPPYQNPATLITQPYYQFNAAGTVAAKGMLFQIRNDTSFASEFNVDMYYRGHGASTSILYGPALLVDANR